MKACELKAEQMMLTDAFPSNQDLPFILNDKFHYLVAPFVMYFIPVQQTKSVFVLTSSFVLIVS